MTPGLYSLEGRTTKPLTILEYDSCHRVHQSQSKGQRRVTSQPVSGQELCGSIYLQHRHRQRYAFRERDFRERGGSQYFKPGVSNEIAATSFLLSKLQSHSPSKAVIVPTFHFSASTARRVFEPGSRELGL